MIEEWRPVVGYQGLYEVSDLGRVRSQDRRVKGRWNESTLRRGRILKQLPAKCGGYPQIKLSRDSVVKTAKVHRLVTEAFLGSCPDGQEVRHHDGCAANVRLDNLCYGTRAANEADKVRHGRSNHGERNGNSKLTALDVAEIRRIVAAKEARQVDLAKRYGLRTSAISRIVTGQRW